MQRFKISIMKPYNEKIHEPKTIDAVNMKNC
jgi:hypothetical protein